MPRTTKKQQRPASLMSTWPTIHFVQRKGYVEAQATWPGEPTLYGRSRQEDVRDGKRYLAIHWYCLGTATYVCNADDVRSTVDRTTVFNCTLLHWGL